MRKTELRTWRGEGEAVGRVPAASTSGAGGGATFPTIRTATFARVDVWTIPAATVRSTAALIVGAQPSVDEPGHAGMGAVTADCGAAARWQQGMEHMKNDEQKGRMVAAANRHSSAERRIRAVDLLRSAAVFIALYFRPMRSSEGVACHMPMVVRITPQCSI